MRRYDALNLSEPEKQELLAYDKAVEKDEATPFDLSPEKVKEAKKFARTGTRKPTAYNFPKKEKTPNATKGGLIAELADFLTHSQFATQDIIITNKERQIAFQIGDDSFELTLVQKRKKK